MFQWQSIKQSSLDEYNGLEHFEQYCHDRLSIALANVQSERSMSLQLGLQELINRSIVCSTCNDGVICVSRMCDMKKF